MVIDANDHKINTVEPLTCSPFFNPLKNDFFIFD